jgi:AcrR family transcriptional regulator
MAMARLGAAINGHTAGIRHQFLSNVAVRCCLIDSKQELVQTVPYGIDTLTRKERTMRKTDQKRQHILETAYRLFQSKGFANTSMSEITAEAGGSKATVYHHFPSKEELFVECMTTLSDQYIDGIFGGLQDFKGELSAALLATGKDALQYLCSPDMLTSKRLLITEAERSGIGKLFYRKMDGYMGELAAILRRAMDEGQLRQADPLLAARQLRALLEADIVERCLMGALKAPPSAAAISRAAEDAVATFLTAYAPGSDMGSSSAAVVSRSGRARQSSAKGK